MCCQDKPRKQMWESQTQGDNLRTCQKTRSLKVQQMPTLKNHNGSVVWWGAMNCSHCQCRCDIIFKWCGDFWRQLGTSCFVQRPFAKKEFKWQVPRSPLPPKHCWHKRHPRKNGDQDTHISNTCSSSWCLCFKYQSRMHFEQVTKWCCVCLRFQAKCCLANMQGSGSNKIGGDGQENICIKSISETGCSYGFSASAAVDGFLKTSHCNKYLEKLLSQTEQRMLFFKYKA